MVNQGTPGYTSTPLSLNLSSSIHTLSSDFGPHHKQAYILKLIPTKMGANPTVTGETQNVCVKTPLTFLFDGGGVDRDEAAACRMAGPQYVLADLARDAREGRGDKAESRAGLHDRPRAARLDGQTVGRGQVPGQVRLQLEFLFLKRSLRECLCVKRPLHEFLSTDGCQHEMSPCEEIFA